MKVSEGDLRKAITFLQSATRLMGGKEITDKIITEIAGVSCASQFLLELLYKAFFLPLPLLKVWLKIVLYSLVLQHGNDALYLPEF